MILGLASMSINDTVWRLSWQAYVSVMRKRVMAMLWLMCCPKGLDRTGKI